MMRTPSWGRAAVAAWIRSVQNADPAIYDVEQHTCMCHPVAHLLWHTPPGENVDHLLIKSSSASDRPLPVALEANSATFTLAAQGIYWPRIASIARRIESGGGSTEVATCLQRTDGRWQVASSSALEIVIAHALLNRRVPVVCTEFRQNRAGVKQALHGVELELSMLGPRQVHRASENEDEDAYRSKLQPEDGWHRFRASASICGGHGTIDPEVVMCSRHLEPICWPKVW